MDVSRRTHITSEEEELTQQGCPRLQTTLVRFQSVLIPLPQTLKRFERSLFIIAFGCGQTSRRTNKPHLVWSGLLPGPGNTYICVYVGAAPLQRHPMVAVALVCVSVQITAARVAQT